MRARPPAVVVLAAWAAALAIACGGKARHAGEPAPAGPPRFPHAAPAHAAAGCVTCHPADAVVRGRPARPGAADHAPCDDAACHARVFEQAPGDLCRICHDEVVPWRAGATTPAAYPPAEGARALASRFSHQVHLDRKRLDDRAGFHVDCGDCHKRAEKAARVDLPGHAPCTRCHDGAAGSPAPALASCDGCHVARKSDPPRARRVIRGDLRFDHAAHESDRAGRAIACITCHEGIAQVGRTGGARPPATRACVGCHDDTARTPPHAAMSQCETCHIRKVGTFESYVAPRSHLEERDRPEDHTLAFRRDHAAEARRDAGRCAGCHASMSGTSLGNCDECHQSMRPSDHGVSWREIDHGPDSAADRDRCATCHGGEFCVACHQNKPRSHFFGWCEAPGGGEHVARAVAVPRTCMTCHLEGTGGFCATCHEGGATCGAP